MQVIIMPHKTIGDIDLYYELHGPSDAPAIVFIEGWGYSSWMWFRQIPVFKQKYRCLVFDNRGVGKSSKPDYPYTMKMFADDTVGLMSALSIETAYILGVSMGGYIAQQIALTYPERIKGLILGSTSFGGPNSIPADDRTLAMMFATPTETLSKEQAMEMRYSVAFDPEYAKKNKSMIEQIQAWRDSDPQPLYARGHQAAATVDFNSEKELKKITLPTLILHGEKDLAVPTTNGEMLADTIPKSKLILIKDGPHLSLIQYYEKFNSAVLTFIDDVEQGQFSPAPKKQVV